MTPTFEHAIEIINALPKSEQEKIFEWAEKQKKTIDKSSVNDEQTKFQLAMKWIEKNRQKYLGQWVCLDGEKLIANGNDAVKIYREAKEKGIKIPFVEHIVEDKEYGGGIEACL
jgi:hypothetical protein